MEKTPTGGRERMKKISTRNEYVIKTEELMKMFGFDKKKEQLVKIEIYRVNDCVAGIELHTSEVLE